MVLTLGIEMTIYWSCLIELKLLELYSVRVLEVLTLGIFSPVNFFNLLFQTLQVLSVSWVHQWKVSSWVYIVYLGVYFVDLLLITVVHRRMPPRFLPSGQVLFINFICLIDLPDNVHFSFIANHFFEDSSALESCKCIKAIFMEKVIGMTRVCPSENPPLLSIDCRYLTILLLFKNLVELSWSKTAILDLSTSIFTERCSFSSKRS